MPKLNFQPFPTLPKKPKRVKWDKDDNVKINTFLQKHVHPEGNTGHPCRKEIELILAENSCSKSLGSGRPFHYLETMICRKINNNRMLQAAMCKRNK